MERNISSLCDIACEKAENRVGQVFICIAGPPGSGKSTLAASLQKRVDAKLGDGSAVVLPMDGFHYSRAALRSMGESGRLIGDPASSTNGETTSYEDLLARRGAPWTFDGPGIVAAFRQATRDGAMEFPTYSRQLSDPVPDGTELLKSHRVVFCEGNYLLAFDDPVFAPLREVWEDGLKWYINADESVLLDRLVERHLETWSDEKTKIWGEGQAGARAKAEANDIKNARWIAEMSRKHADLVIESVHEEEPMLY